MHVLDRLYPPASRGGYTLIELLIVIAVLGLAGALLVPHLVDRPSLTVQATVRQVISDLTFAQSDALAHQEYRRVHFYDDGRGYCILRAQESDYATPFTEAMESACINDPLAAAGELGRFIVDFATDKRFEGVHIESVDIDNGREDLVYDPLGGTIRPGNLPGTGGTIILAADVFRYEITVAPFTGKLTVTELAGP